MRYGVLVAPKYKKLKLLGCKTRGLRNVKEKMPHREKDTNTDGAIELIKADFINSTTNKF
jgi:hypothetical protein